MTTEKSFRKYDPTLPLIFMHVPKCGGVSVMRILKRYYGDRYVRPSQHSFARLSCDPRLSAEAPSCIHEHFNIYRNDLRSVFPEASQIFTIIRDPYDMLLSLYQYGVQRQGETLAKTCGSLNSFLDCMLERRGTASLFTWLPKKDPCVSLEEYSRQFMFIGVTEDLQASMDFLASVIGMPVCNVSIANKSAKAGDYSMSRKQEIRNYLSEEYEIFEMARKALAVGRPLGWAGESSGRR